MHVPFGGQSRGAAFSDDNQPSRMQIRNTVNRTNNYNLTAHVGCAQVVVISTEVHLALQNLCIEEKIGFLPKELIVSPIDLFNRHLFNSNLKQQTKIYKAII